MMRVEIHRHLERWRYRSDCFDGLRSDRRAASLDFDPLELPLDGALRHTTHIRGILAAAPVIDQDSGLSETAEKLIYGPSDSLTRRIV